MKKWILLAVSMTILGSVNFTFAQTDQPKKGFIGYWKTNYGDVLNFLDNNTLVLNYDMKIRTKYVVEDEGKYNCELHDNKFEYDMIEVISSDALSFSGDHKASRIKKEEYDRLRSQQQAIKEKIDGTYKITNKSVGSAFKGDVAPENFAQNFERPGEIMIKEGKCTIGSRRFNVMVSPIPYNNLVTIQEDTYYPIKLSPEGASTDEPDFFGGRDSYYWDSDESNIVNIFRISGEWVRGEFGPEVMPTRWVSTRYEKNSE